MGNDLSLMSGNEPEKPIGPITGASILVIVEGAALIIKRGKEPSKGLWALPGGRQEAGETMAEAAARELQEETGLTAKSLRFLTLIEPMRKDSEGNLISHYVLGVFFCEEVSGTLAAGDDAQEAKWVRRSDLAAHDFTGSSLEIIQRHLPV